MSTEKSKNILTIADFVRETVTEITKGLREAQEATRDAGTQIFPDSYGDKTTKTSIDFDLAVTQASKDGGFSLGVAGFGFKAGLKDGEFDSEIINRVKFTIDVGFVIFHEPNSKFDWGPSIGGIAGRM